MLDEIEEGRLCPVDVVENDHERLRTCQRLEEPTNGNETLLAGAGAGDLGEADQLRDTERD